MKDLLTKNFWTTAFGILAGLPVLVTQACASMGVPLSSNWTHALGIVGACGLIGLGVVAKAFNTHSTVAQVQAASASANQAPVPPAKG